MAILIETSLPLWLPGCTYDGDNGNDLRNSGVVPYFFNQGILSGSVIGTRAGVIGGAGLAVTAASGMNVTAAPGSFTVPVSGSPQSGAYVSTLSQSGTLSVTAADPSNPRIDLVYAIVTDNGDSTSTGSVRYVAGTAAASPAAPSVPAGGLALATMTIPALTTSITAGMIADKRQFTVAPGGVMPAAKAAVPGYNGMLAYDSASDSFYHNGASGSRQARVLPFAPVSASRAATGIGLGTANAQQTITSVMFTCDGSTDIKITCTDAGAYMNNSTGAVSFWVERAFYLDGTSIFNYNIPQNQNVGLSNAAGGGTTVLHTGASGFAATPSAGTHTVSFRATEFGQGGTTYQVFLLGPVVLRVEPVTL